MKTCTKMRMKTFVVANSGGLLKRNVLKEEAGAYWPFSATLRCFDGISLFICSCELSFLVPSKKEEKGKVVRLNYGYSLHAEESGNENSISHSHPGSTLKLL